jgi:SAM-dependent MidA family methyltransferase
VTEVESIIRQEIFAYGSISFARFMELALYCPKIGYYERARPIGRKGDFYTSVSVGPLFGELLARQYIEWLGELAAEGAMLVEAGGHDGQLAGDILGAMKRLGSELPIRYAIVEPSDQRRAIQQAKLELFADKITWFASLEALPKVTGVIFSNELLNAMPVHILQWRGGKWAELKVMLKDDAFAWQGAELMADLGQPNVSAELAAVLPDGFQIEVCKAAREWWRTAASKLARGKLITFDYGFEADEFLAPQRAAGTLRAYHRHHLSEDALARPGEQDITAHVNFTEIENAGEAAGLRTEMLTAQSRFLTEIAEKVSHWSAERVRQFQTLTHPEHLGRAFKVLIQSR